MHVLFNQKQCFIYESFPLFYPDKEVDGISQELAINPLKIDNRISKMRKFLNGKAPQSTI